MYYFYSITGHNVPIDLHTNNGNTTPFRSWSIPLSTLFKKPPGIQSYHFFQVRKSSSGNLYMKNLPSDEWKCLNMRKAGKTQDDSFQIDVPVQIPKGLNPEKTYDLWKRYREYVPDIYKDTLYQKPSEDIITKITGTKRQRVYGCIARRKDAVARQTGIKMNIMNDGVDNQANVNEVIDDGPLDVPKKRGRGRPKKIAI